MLILYISQGSQDDCLYVDFEYFILALWPTLRQKFMNFWSFLTRPGDNHDENIQQFREACRSSRFCCESHDFLTFLTTRLPISWFLVKYHSEMKCFFVKKNGNVYCCWIVSDSPHVNGEWIASCKRLRDGFARHSLQYLSKSVPVWAYLCLLFFFTGFKVINVLIPLLVVFLLFILIIVVFICLKK